jgi:hypothetical protein
MLCLMQRHQSSISGVAFQTYVRGYPLVVDLFAITVLLHAGQSLGSTLLVVMRVIGGSLVHSWETEGP